MSLSYTKVVIHVEIALLSVNAQILQVELVVIVDEESVREVDCREVVDDLMLYNRPLALHLGSFPDSVGESIVLESNNLQLTQCRVSLFVIKLIDGLNLSILDDKVQVFLCRLSLCHKFVIQEDTEILLIGLRFDHDNEIIVFRLHFNLRATIGDLFDILEFEGILFEDLSLGIKDESHKFKLIIFLITKKNLITFAIKPELLAIFVKGDCCIFGVFLSLEFELL